MHSSSYRSASDHPALNRKPGELIIYYHGKHLVEFFQAGCKLITPFVSEKHG